MGPAGAGVGRARTHVPSGPRGRPTVVHDATRGGSHVRTRRSGQRSRVPGRSDRHARRHPSCSSRCSAHASPGCCPTARTETIAEIPGGPNGAAVGPGGLIYVCNNGGRFTETDMGGADVPRCGDDGRTTSAVASRPSTRRRAPSRTCTPSATADPLRAPNDLVFDAHGGFYFTDHGLDDDEDSRDQILARLSAERGNLDALAPEDLFQHDQDHYGGLEVVDALAQRAMIGPGRQVADFCAGLGGPARYLAHKYGAVVTCIELNPDRAPGAWDLTRRVGLAGRVRVVRGDVMRVPLAGDCMDAVISQEALLHVPDKRAALAEASGILKKGGCLAFTDWAEHRRLDAATMSRCGRASRRNPSRASTATGCCWSRPVSVHPCRGSDRRLGGNPGAALCHVPAAARRDAARRNAVRRRCVLQLLCTTGGTGAVAGTRRRPLRRKNRPPHERMILRTRAFAPYNPAP